MSLETDIFFMRKVYEFAKEYSEDPRTNTGALIVQKGFVSGKGVNRIPDNLKRLPEMFEKDNKKNYIHHAERRAIAFCAKYGKVTDGSTMYTYWEPCSDCSLMIMDSGISELVLHKELNDFARNNTDSFWLKEQDIALKNMINSGINVRYLEGKLFKPEENFFINFRGSPFFP